MANLFDTHAHLMDAAFQEDFTEFIKDVEETMTLVMNIGCNLPDAYTAVKMAEEHERFYAAVALHPNDANQYTDQLWQEMTALAKHEKVLAIGETGLDYYWKDATPEVQKELFLRHIQLAKSLRKPVIIHDRDAHHDTLEIMHQSNIAEVGGIFHAYSGSVEMAREVLDMNFYIALGGAVTFKNANRLLEVAKFVPLDRLLLETDCPYLTPVPFRGKRNHPKYIQYTAARIAELRGVSTESILQATYENGKRAFGIS